ncbi:AI-2E family transporter [Bacillus nakamurai]|uniref:AI-2E family transporter n=1 Tax=Bacillus nakamurai TaxID=1793963 RepID=UPI0020C4B306|nr:AI-2E family transporter [Bacillus nakamurai]MCP6681161.1 AI-2E family transporter [Bacillus nakamurai]
MLFLIIYLGTLIDFLFQPIVITLKTLFPPIVLSGVLYYLCRPLVRLLHTKAKLPKGIAVLAIYAGAGGLFALLLFTAGPAVQKQFTNFIDHFPELTAQAKNWIGQLQDNKWFSRLQKQDSFRQMADKTADYSDSIVASLGGLAETAANAAITIVIIPFALYYMLKEGNKAPQRILRLLPEKHQKERKKILQDMDEALSSYIQGQLIVSFCVGVLVTIGYFIIGLDYPLILGAFAMVTNLIPFIRPWIGTFPGVIVGLFDSPAEAVLVIVVVVIVQQLESQLISPQIMGRKLAIHPLTIIFLLLAAGKFAGIIGMLLAIPGYAVAKVIVSHLQKLFILRKKRG